MFLIALLKNLVTCPSFGNTSTSRGAIPTLFGGITADTYSGRYVFRAELQYDLLNKDTDVFAKTIAKH